MTLYFLHLRDGTDIALDEEGSEHDSLASLSAAMLEAARDLMRGDVHKGRLDLRLRVDAETADGTLARSLPFPQALEIIFPEAERE
ncbi:MAG TPA: hypothetical protein VF605_16250 [Allosphingosinicella sp.]|jgi:hypothetical protein